MKNYFKHLYIIILIAGLPFIVDAQVVFPVKTSTNGRYLVDQNNQPFPILGRTAWFVLSQPVKEYQAFMDNTLSYGYNSIELYLGHDPSGNHPPFNGKGDFPFLKQVSGAAWNGSILYSDIDKEAPDMTTPNEEYWKFVDDFFSYCESKGILVFFFPGYVGSGGESGWMKELVANGPVKIKAYSEWIARRYKNQKNLVWMLLGDKTDFTPAQKIVEAALIKGLKSVPGQQSIHYSAEPYNGDNCADNKDFGDQMTLNGVYTWGPIPSLGLTGKTVPALGRIAYSHNPVLPAYLLEEPYDEEGPDGNKINPNATQPVRRFQWWGWLSTIGGYISGNGYVWTFNPSIWQKHLNTQCTIDMGRLNTFIKSITWWQLVPSGLNGMKNLIANGGSVDSSSDYVAAAANPDGTLLIAYIPPDHTGSITVDLTVLKKNITAYWYDPTNGSSTAIYGSPFTNKSTHQFTAPGKNSIGQNDWVLKLVAQEF